MISDQGDASGGMAMAFQLRVMLAAAGAAMLCACTPAAEDKAGDPVAVEPGAPEVTAEAGSGAEEIKPQNPFFGGWAMTSAKIAPWPNTKDGEPAADPAFSSNVVLGANKSSGPGLLNCDKPKYAVSIVSPRSLFAGNLADPGKDATDLGFESSEIRTLNFTCADKDPDGALDFHMIDDDTIMLGLDNVLYTFKRARG